MAGGEHDASVGEMSRAGTQSGTRPIAFLPKPQTWRHTSTEAIRLGLCARCGEAAGTFTNVVSRIEYRISGMCQECQDVFFQEYPESASHPEKHDYGPREDDR